MHYWETWEKQTEMGVVHWGIVGQQGQNKEVKSTEGVSFKVTIGKEVEEKMQEGYRKIPMDAHSTLLIEYKVDGTGTNIDVDKRQRLESKMNETLGWTGLGKCDGGSIGSGAMEVGCFVVDFSTAKKIIEQDLKGTEFADYTRIYHENATWENS